MELLLIALVLLLAIILPLYAIYRRVKSGKRSKTPFIANLCCFFGLVLVGSVVLFTQSASAAETAETAVAAGDAMAKGLGYIGAALAVGLSGIGGGIAVGSAASSALGAISENDSVFGKSLIFVGLAEGIALYGMLIAFMIISSL